jgi:hypothetical protein
MWIFTSGDASTKALPRKILDYFGSFTGQICTPIGQSPLLQNLRQLVQIPQRPGYTVTFTLIVDYHLGLFVRHRFPRPDYALVKASTQDFRVLIHVPNAREREALFAASQGTKIRTEELRYHVYPVVHQIDGGGS